MSTNIINIIRRGDMPPISHTMATLLTVLLVLIIVSVCLVGTLIFLRQRRKARKHSEAPPPYQEKRGSTSSTHSHHRRVTVRPSQSIHIYNEKQLFEDSCEPPSPTSPLPEIRITFPEEIDATGKRQSGRVVVVHVGDSSVGLEPLSEKLPAYYQSEGGRFQSIDLERVGGLMEKETRPPLGWR